MKTFHIRFKKTNEVVKETYTFPAARRYIEDCYESEIENGVPFVNAYEIYDIESGEVFGDKKEIEILRVKRLSANKVTILVDFLGRSTWYDFDTQIVNGKEFVAKGNSFIASGFEIV